MYLLDISQGYLDYGFNHRGFRVPSDFSSNGGSIKTRVYVSLKKDLITGVIPPGGFLQEKELARTFGVSKTPVREALSELVKDRFLKLLPRKGYLVAPIEPQEVVENIELREILECSAIQLAARRISPAELDDLTGLILPQPAVDNRLSHQDQFEAYATANIQFHQKLAAASGNRSLARAVTKALEDLLRVIFLSYSLPNLEETGEDHLELVDCLRQRDADRARNVMERHLQVTRQRVLSAFWGKKDRQDVAAFAASGTGS
ncbi:MAG: GntR family transcriptional regulator [Nitrospinota bacterium]|nr:GntR family transcriptional regulator [Nitrospinota bacterium]